MGQRRALHTGIRYPVTPAVQWNPERACIVQVVTRGAVQVRHGARFDGIRSSGGLNGIYIY